MSTTKRPTPIDPAALTGPRAAVWAALNDHPGETPADLATAAGVGQSTASKALVILEEAGLARRDPGARVSGRRTADRWHPIPTDGATGTTETAPLDIPDAPDDPRHHDPAHHDATGLQNTPAPGPDDASTPGPDDALTSGTTEPGPEGLPTDPDPGHDQTAEPVPAVPPTEGDRHQPDPAPDTTNAPDNAITPPQAAPTSTPGGKKRLAPGSLRQMVIDHLRAYPGQTFTATAISRAIDKSSGAIANALNTLAKQGVAEQVTAKPRTYRLAAPGTE